MNLTQSPIDKNSPQYHTERKIFNLQDFYFQIFLKIFDAEQLIG